MIGVLNDLKAKSQHRPLANSMAQRTYSIHIPLDPKTMKNEGSKP